MDIRVQHPKLAYIEANLNIETVVRSYFPEYEPGQLLLCPSHEDKKPSLTINEDGSAKCFSCNFWARNIVDLCAQLDEMSFDKMLQSLYEEVVNAIPEALVKKYATLLPLKAVEYLVSRYISLETIKKFQIGYEPASERIVIPIRDQFGTCVNLRRMGWLKIHKEKAINADGHGEIRVFPEDRLIKERRIVLVEGEWDCLAGRSAGLPTVTWTGGAKGWNDKHTHLFANKAVWILYDNDRAGEEGADQAYEILISVAYATMQLVPLSKKGNDLTNWIKLVPKKVAELVCKTKLFAFAERKPKKKFCPTCHQEIK